MSVDTLPPDHPGSAGFGDQSASGVIVEQDISMEMHEEDLDITFDTDDGYTGQHQGVDGETGPGADNNPDSSEREFDQQAVEPGDSYPDAEAVVVREQSVAADLGNPDADAACIDVTEVLDELKSNPHFEAEAPGSSAAHHHSALDDNEAMGDVDDAGNAEVLLEVVQDSPLVRETSVAEELGDVHESSLPEETSIGTSSERLQHEAANAELDEDQVDITASTGTAQEHVNQQDAGETYEADADGHVDFSDLNGLGSEHDAHGSLPGDQAGLPDEGEATTHVEPEPDDYDEEHPESHLEQEGNDDFEGHTPSHIDQEQGSDGDVGHESSHLEQGNGDDGGDGDENQSTSHLEQDGVNDNSNDHVDYMDASELDPSSDDFPDRPQVRIRYRNTNYSLFSTSKSDDPYSYFFSDIEALDHPLSQFLAGLREVLSDELSPDEELLIRIDRLGLEFAETMDKSLLGRTTFGTIVDLHDRLVKADDPNSQDTVLLVYLVTRPNAMRRLDSLLDGANIGEGLSAYHMSYPEYLLVDFPTKGFVKDPTVDDTLSADEDEEQVDFGSDIEVNDEGGDHDEGQDAERDSPEQTNDAASDWHESEGDAVEDEDLLGDSDDRAIGEPSEASESLKDAVPLEASQKVPEDEAQEDKAQEDEAHQDEAHQDEAQEDKAPEDTIREEEAPEDHEMGGEIVGDEQAEQSAPEAVAHKTHDTHSVEATKTIDNNLNASSQINERDEDPTSHDHEQHANSHERELDQIDGMIAEELAASDRANDDSHGVSAGDTTHTAYEDQGIGSWDDGDEDDVEATVAAILEGSPAPLALHEDNAEAHVDAAQSPPPSESGGQDWGADPRHGRLTDATADDQPLEVAQQESTEIVIHAAVSEHSSASGTLDGDEIDLEEVLAANEVKTNGNPAENAAGEQPDTDEIDWDDHDNEDAVADGATSTPSSISGKRPREVDEGEEPDDRHDVKRHRA